MSTNLLTVCYFICSIILVSIAGYLTIRTKKESSISKATGVLGMLLPISFFYYLLYILASDVPFTDDYNLLASFQEMLFSSDLLSRIKALFEQVNEHRFAYERLIMLTIYKCAGYESIRFQILFGNMLLLGIFLLICRIIYDLKLSILYYIPLSLFLFNLSFHENAFWGIAAVQNTSLLFFALLSSFGLSLKKPGYTFYLALVVAVLGSFTSGSGLSIWPIGAIILLFQSRHRQLVIWLGFAVLCITFYFIFDYTFLSKDRSSLTEFPFANLKFALGFWGISFIVDSGFTWRQYNIDFVLAVFAGLGLFGIFSAFWVRSFILRQRLTASHWFTLGGMLFCISTGCMLVISRPIAGNILEGGSGIFSNRYVIFGAIFISLGYSGLMLLLKNWPAYQKYVLIAALPIALYINLSSYYISIPSVIRLTEELKLDGLYWKNHKMLLSFGGNFQEKPFWNHPTEFSNLIRSLQANGIYVLKFDQKLDMLSSSATHSSFSLKNTDTKVTILTKRKSDWMGVPKEYITLRITPTRPLPGKITQIVLQSKSHVFVLPALNETNPLKSLIMSGNYFSKTVSYSFWKTKFPQERYEILALMLQKDNTVIPISCGSISGL